MSNSSSSFALRRRAIRLYGNTAHARKWLRSIATLGEEWLVARPVPIDVLRERERTRITDLAKVGREALSRQRDVSGILPIRRHATPRI